MEGAACVDIDRKKRLPDFMKGTDSVSTLGDMAQMPFMYDQASRRFTHETGEINLFTVFVIKTKLKSIQRTCQDARGSI